MYSVVRASWTLFLGLGFIMLGNGLQGSLLGVRASLEGFSTANTGLIMTGYYVGFLAGSLLIPRAIGNVGHIRVFAALASLASTSVLVHTVFISIPVWVAMRLVTGFAYAGLYIVAESWINDQATNKTRGQLLSIYMLVSMGGMAGGQTLLSVDGPEKPTLFILTSVLVSLALVPISLAVVSAPRFETPARTGIRELYRSSPLGIVGMICAGVVAGGLFGMGAVYATAIGLSVSQVGLFMAVAILGSVLLQWPIGWASDRFDRRRVMTIVTFLAAGAAALTALSSINYLALFIAVALFGGLSVPLYSLSIAHTNDHLEPEKMVAASATLVMLNGIGASFGPLSAAWMMNALGPNGLFWWLALLHALLGGFALYRMVRREAVALEDQGHYAQLPPPASPLAATIAAEEAIQEQKQH